MLAPTVLRADDPDLTIEHDEHRYGDYVITITDTGIYDIQNGYRVYDRMWMDLDIVRNGVNLHHSRWEDDAVVAIDSNIPIGTDVTGLGRTNLVIRASTGIHCCFLAEIFELGDELKLIATLDGTLNDVKFLRDENGGWRVQLWDWVFGYWHASRARSPACRILLRWRGDGFHLAAELMRRRPPPQRELQRRARMVRDDDWGDPSVEDIDRWNVTLWSTMLQLIYTGNPADADRFFDAAWRPQVPGKEAFRAEFYETLHQSHYWAEIEALSRLPLPKAAFDPKAPAACVNDADE